MILEQMMIHRQTTPEQQLAICLQTLIACSHLRATDAPGHHHVNHPNLKKSLKIPEKSNYFSRWVTTKRETNGRSNLNFDLRFKQ
jgi:hypothetical protein